MSKGIKSIIIIATVLPFVIICVVVFSSVWGDKPRIKNFDDIYDDYEIIARLSLEYYDEISSDAEHIMFLTYDDYIEDSTNNSKIYLTDEQKDAIKCVNEKFAFGCLWVTGDAVIFWSDETKKYGLIYSDDPMETIIDIKSDWYDAMEYHKINKNWYEVGNFGR